MDLYFVLQTGLPFEALFARAWQKAIGLQPFFAGALLQVQRLRHLPDMLKPLSLEEVREFFVALANGLLDRLNPERDQV